eukprot:6195647-Pleurochrysis_carterae.AAC.9
MMRPLEGEALDSLDRQRARDGLVPVRMRPVHKRTRKRNGGSARNRGEVVMVEWGRGARNKGRWHAVSGWFRTFSSAT